MAGPGRAVGFVLVALGLAAIASRAIRVSESPLRVLVLVDSVVEHDPAVRAAVFPPRPPLAADGVETEVRLSPFAVWDPLAVPDIATEAEPFDAVVVVTDGRLPLDAAAARETGARLAARGVTVSVAMVPREVKDEPGRPSRPVRVLYVEQYPRWEFVYLSKALLRDPELKLATCLVEGNGDVSIPPFPALDPKSCLSSGAALDEYDVIVLGDVDAASLVPHDAPDRDVPMELRAWVERGGGLLLIAGARHIPAEWTSRDFAAVLPVEVGEAVPSGVHAPAEGSFNLHLTPEGAASPILDVADDREQSRARWETDPHWTQYWAFPASRAAAGAVVLATGRDRPVVVSRTAGKGRVFYVGVDELWRMRWDVGDRYFARFYRRAIDWLTETKIGRSPPTPAPPAPGAEGLRELARAANDVSVGVDATAFLAPRPREFWSPSRRAEARRGRLVAVAGAALAVVGAILLLRRRLP